MVEIFRTNVPDAAAAENIRSQLLHAFPCKRITFDLEDCDKVMKVVPERKLLPDQVMVLVQRLGYNIELLD